MSFEVQYETELWREERSHASVERELLLQKTLQRRKVSTNLCEFVCGVREVRIPISSSSASSSSSSSSSPSNKNISSSSIHSDHNQVERMHRLKYYATRACSAPLSAPLSGTVDDQDARYDAVRKYVVRRHTLQGKAVRSALRDIIGQVSALHEGGCSHNDIALRSVCLATNLHQYQKYSHVNMNCAPPGTALLLKDDISASTILLYLTRFGYATEFQGEREFPSSSTLEYTSSSSPAGARRKSQQQQQKNNHNNNEIPALLQRNQQHSKLAIAPNILALCEIDGSSADKVHRVFHARAEAERINRQQQRRPLPLSVPVCGPVCDVQGLVSMAAVLFQHLLDAGDEIFGHRHQQLLARTGSGFFVSSSPTAGGRQKLINQQQHQQQQQNQQNQSGDGPPALDIKFHKFWSCDVEPGLKKYVAGTSEEYLSKAHEWLSSKGGIDAAFRVVDEVIASPQLASFRIESLAENSSNNNSTSTPTTTTNNDNASKNSSSPKLQKQHQQQQQQQMLLHQADEDDEGNFQQSSLLAEQQSAAAAAASCSIATCGAPATELRWILSRVLSQHRLPIPTAHQLQIHPFFWSSRRTAQFLIACAQFFCQQELINEILRQFCNFPPPKKRGGNNTSSSSPTSPSSNNTENIKRKQNSEIEGKKIVDPNIQQDPDGIATKHADSLRRSLTVTSSASSASSFNVTATSSASPSPFASLGSGSSPSRKTATSLVDAYQGSHASFISTGSVSGLVVPSASSSSSPTRRDLSDISAITTSHQSPSPKNQKQQQQQPEERFLAAEASLNFYASGVFEPPSSSSSLPIDEKTKNNKKEQKQQQQQQQQQQQISSSSSLSPSKPSFANSVVSADSNSTGRGGAGGVDENMPPNNVAKMLNCSNLLIWWGNAEFRADATSHKDNYCVWLQLLADTVGSSQHPFSTINTQSGRIRNSRGDLLLFIAALVAKMLDPQKSNVKICGGDAMQFVSLCVHSRFPAMQMLLIELLSRRSTDAQKFCDFVRDQENAAIRQPSLAMPLFAATESLWTTPGARSFGEELSEMFRFWA